MRSKPDNRIEQGRIRSGSFASLPGTIWGAFIVQGPCGRTLKIISDDGRDGPDQLRGWEHVSISLEDKHPPNWTEMAWVKDRFWNDEETVLQFHPKKSAYKNLHPNCLHLWRRVGVNHPLPPQALV